MASGHAAILAFTMPLWAAVLGVLFLGERMDGRRLASLALGAAGIVVLLSHDFGALGTSAWGAAIILLAAFMWAVGVLIQKHVTWSIEPLAQAAWQMGIGILPICVIAELTEPFAYQHASWLVLGCSAFVGVVGVAYCYFAWFSVVRIFPAQVSAIGSLMVPIVGAVTATWTLGEPFGWREIAALGLVVGAVALVLLRPQPAGETGAETTAETAAATAAPGRSE
jgi:drug/metabolite transporter (DMT)-like permease